MAATPNVRNWGESGHSVQRLWSSRRAWIDLQIDMARSGRDRFFSSGNDDTL
jgi:hypothetical protein